MKIRVSKWPFWSIFWFLSPIHVLVCSFPVVNVISFLRGDCAFESVKANILVGLIYVITCLLVFFILYIVWRIKHPIVLVFGKKQGAVKNRGRITHRFHLRSVSLHMEYSDISDLVLRSFEFGKTIATIWLEDDSVSAYLLAISRLTAKRLQRRLEKSRL